MSPGWQHWEISYLLSLIILGMDTQTGNSALVSALAAWGLRAVRTGSCKREADGILGGHRGSVTL